MERICSREWGEILWDKKGCVDFENVISLIKQKYHKQKCIALNSVGQGKYFLPAKKTVHNTHDMNEDCRHERRNCHICIDEVSCVMYNSI